MKKIAAAAFLLALLASARAAHAIGPFGPPGPVLASDQYNSVEAGYFLYRSTWKASANVLGVTEFQDIDIEQTHGYVQGTIWAIRDGDVFLRAGGADFTETTSGGSFASKAKPFGSAGARYAFVSLPRSGVYAGAVVQASLYASYGDERPIPVAPVAEAKADVHSYFDLALGLGLEKVFAERFTVYGGPFAFYSQARGHFSSPALNRDVKTQFKDKNNLGVFAGARIAVWRGLSVDGEVQARGGTSYGVKLSYAF